MEILRAYGVGIYLLSSRTIQEYYDDPYETAYELYHQNTLGMGEDRDGVIPADEHVRPEICHVLLWAEGGIRL